MIADDMSGQASAELILLIAGIIMVVISAIFLYNDYITDFGQEINNTEVNDLLDKIDKISEKIK